MGNFEELVAQLTCSNRRWKALALTACAANALMAVIVCLAVTRQWHQVEVERRQAMSALARVQVQAANLHQAK